MSFPRPGVMSMATTVICLLALAACSDAEPAPRTGEAPSAEPTAESPPRLEEEWRIRARVFAGSVQVRMTPDVLALVSEENLRGVDRRTGEERWTVRPPRDLNRICFTSEQISPDGLVGVLMAGRGRDCTVAGAVDLDRGKLLWTRTMPSAPPYHSGHGVTVGDTTLSAEMFCDEMRRFSLRDGKPLQTLAPRDRKCAMEAASNGELIAVLNDPATPRTPDDHGTGWIPAVGEPVGLELYDADSGRRLWRRAVSNEGASVDDVVSTEPTILTRTLRGHKLTQIYGPDGRPGPYLGKQLPAFGSDKLQVLGHPDGLLVATYPVGNPLGGDHVVYGYDDRTDEERWRLPVAAGWRPVGADGTGVLMAGAGYTEDGQPEQWLTRHDLDDPSEVETLGSVAGRGILAADGSTIYTVTDNEILAYSLPASGPEGAPELTAAAGIEWAEDDVRPEDAAGACDAVTPETLARLGFQSPGLPAPVDCRFAESFEPRHVHRELHVSVQVVPPNSAEDQPATEAAEAAVTDVAVSMSPTPADRVLGDESWSSRERAGLGWTGSMVARWRNVIVTVTATQEVLLEDRRAFSVPARELQAAARVAAAQVLEAIRSSVSRRRG